MDPPYLPPPPQPPVPSFFGVESLNGEWEDSDCEIARFSSLYHRVSLYADTLPVAGRGIDAQHRSSVFQKMRSLACIGGELPLVTSTMWLSS